MSAKGNLKAPRRIAEAVSFHLEYDFLCYKGDLFGEEYISSAVGDVLCSMYTPPHQRVLKDEGLKILSSNGRGRRAAADYLVHDLDKEEYILAIEAKWAGSSHCQDCNILKDLRRLQVIRNMYESLEHAVFLLAGKRESIDDLFRKGILEQGKRGPLRNSKTLKPKTFNLVGNENYNSLIGRCWSEFDDQLKRDDLPRTIKSKQYDSLRSGSEHKRFLALAWEIW